MDDLVLIPAVTPDSQSWKCKVMVVKKQNVRESKTTPGKKYKPIIFQDDSGNKVQAMSYDNEIDVVDERLKLYSTYIISNASVKPARDLTNLPDPNYRNLWNITRKTMIQDVSVGDGIDIAQSPQLHMTPFSEFYKYLSSGQFINVIAIVIYKLPRQFIVTKNGQEKVNEFVIINQEAKPVVLTLWESFVMAQGIQIDLQLRQGKFPVIIAQGVNVNAFQGISLGTRYDTSIEVNPLGEETRLLNEWKDANMVTIHQTIVDKSFLDSFLTLANPLQQPICQIPNLENHLKQKPIAWVKGKVRLINRGGLDYYVGCNYCNKKVNSMEGLHLHCLHCGQTDGLTVKRYRLNVEIFDGETTVQATVFNHDVNRLLFIAKIQMPTNMNDTDIFQDKINALEFIVGLRKGALNTQQTSTASYIVACICEKITTPEQSLTLGNTTKRRLDFDDPSQNTTDVAEDDTSEDNSVAYNKGKKVKLD